MQSSTLRIALLTIILAVTGAAMGYMLYESVTPNPVAMPVAAQPPQGDVPEMRPDFTLADLQGTPRSIGEWDDSVLMVNFWATWCPPCQREIPAFMELQEAYGEQGFQIVGVAIDDPDRVQEYAEEMGINYPILVGELDAVEVSQAYGNRIGALPYTVIADRSGRIVYTHRGELHKEDAERILLPLL
jgi:thiol-disulfide isomerase/thioredoxin